MVVLPMPRWPEKMYPWAMRFWLERVEQRARYVVLAGHVGKALRTIFSGQNLVTHAILRSSLVPQNTRGTEVIVSVQGWLTLGGNRLTKVCFGVALGWSWPVTTGQMSSPRKQASLVAQAFARSDEMVAQMCDSFHRALRVSPRNR